MAEEGGAAVVPPQRHGADLRRPGRGHVVGQGAVQVRRHDRRRFPPRRLPRRPRLRSCAAPPTSRPASCCCPRSSTSAPTSTRAPWSTPGPRSASCAQIGKNCHISGGAGIGGVLEPLQAGPVIIEDNCFIGARAEVAEGVMVGEGSVLSMGVYLGASTTIIDRATGEKYLRQGAAVSRSSCRARWPASRCPTASPARTSTAPSSSSRSTPRRAPRPRSTSCCGTEPASQGVTR